MDRHAPFDPTNVIAHLVDAAVHKSITADVAHTLTAAHPDDWRAWWLAWRAAQNSADAREARDTTCALVDANPTYAPIEQCARVAIGSADTNACAEDILKKLTFPRQHGGTFHMSLPRLKLPGS